MFESRTTQKVSADEIADALVRMSAGISRRIARFLSLVAVFDRLELYRDWGCSSTATWLRSHCELHALSAREYVRVARALVTLPNARAAFEDGSVSYTKVRALTRVATPEAERTYLNLALRMSADEFADLVVRTRRTKVATDPSFARRHRSVRIYTDDEGMLCLNARLSPADGAIIRPLLSRAARDAGVTAVTDEEDLDAAPPGERMVADALMHVMLSYGSGTSSNPVQPVFLIDATKKIARTPDGVLLHPTAAERLLCDAVLMRVSSRAGGKLEAGRATRTVTRAMRRVIGTRDGGVCRFPGCHNRRHLQPHHIRHWARDKGPTDVDNLILLCTHHHKLVHEGGFQLWVGSDGRILAKSPTGRLMIRDGPLAKVG